jgi:hypothetical protein
VYGEALLLLSYPVVRDARKISEMKKLLKAKRGKGDVLFATEIDAKRGIK